MAIFAHILVAFDGSPGSERALQLAAQLAGAHGASLVVLSVVEHLPRFAGTVGEVDEALRAQSEMLQARQQYALQLAAEYGIAQRKGVIETGHAAQWIVQFAEQEHADLLVLGHSGHSQVWGRFMGSTADKIVRHAPCSVLIAR